MDWVRIVLIFLIVVLFGRLNFALGSSYGKRKTLKDLQALYIHKGPDMILALLDPVSDEIEKEAR